MQQKKILRKFCKGTFCNLTESWKNSWIKVKKCQECRLSENIVSDEICKLVSKIQEVIF